MRTKAGKEPIGRRVAQRGPAVNGEMWQSVIENSLLGYAILQDGRVMFCNKALTAICGFSSKELLEMTAEEVAKGFHPEDRQRALKVIADRLQRKHPDAVQRLRIRHKDGNYRWVETTSVRFELKGRPALQVLYMNVTDRMLAEINLRESEAKLRGLIEKNIIGIVLVDENRRIAEWNHEMEEITGVPGSAVRGRHSNVLRKLLPAAWTPLRGGVQSLARAGGVSTPGSSSAAGIFEGPILSASGTRKMVRTSIFPIPLEQGRQFAGMVEDVTDQRRAEAAYRVLVENSLVGFAIIQEGRIVFCNEVLALLSGYSRSETYAMSAAQVAATIHPDERELVLRAMQEILAKGGRIPPRRLRVICKNGDVRWVQALVARTEFDSRPAIQVSYLDVTDLYETERSLRESEERFRTLIENAPVAIGVSREGRIVYCNRACLEMFGIERVEDIIGRPFTDQYAPQCYEELRQRALRRSKGHPEEAEFETTGMRSDGAQFPCRVAVTELDLFGGRAAMAFISNLTSIKEAERKLMDTHAKLRNLAVHLLSAREEERKKVAREIHDEIGQVLTALKMDARWLQKQIDIAEPKLYEKVHGIVELANQAIETVHRISSELRPGMLDDLGLGAALEWLVSDFIRRTGIPCKMKVSFTESRIGGNSATDIFRIAQEALTNIARHAQASSSSVSIQESGDRLTIEIRDDGIGITEKQSSAPSSFGLIGIRERVNALGGEVSVGVSGRRGTSLRVVIPLPGSGAPA